MKKKQNLDFLFITSPTNARNPHPPYYFLYLAGYLRGFGCSVRIIDPKGGDRPRDIREHFQRIYRELFQYRPRFVGLGAFHSDYPTIMSLGRVVKWASPETTLVVGNVHPTLDPQDFIYPESPFDVAVLGEGEEVCWDLLLESDWEKIRGVAFLKDGQLYKTLPREFIDLSELSLPAYDLIDMDYYLRPQKLIIRRAYASMVCVFAGRGCPYHCDFCAANSVWKANKGKYARLRPVADVMTELTVLREKYKVDFVYLFDDMFGMSEKWMKEWFEQKADWDRMFGPLPYACQTRADVASEEMIQGLKETGCIQVDIGVESGSQFLLDVVSKGITLDQVRRVFGWCRKYKIRSFATMLLNLPYEAEGDLEATYRFLKEIRPSAGVIFSVTTPYPGTKIYTGTEGRKKLPDLKPITPLKKEEYSLLINNRLNPIERFRMASHRIDLEKLWDKWNRKFRATPMFERMWCLWPFQPLYWKAVLRSKRLKSYLWCWAGDLPKTFLLWWAHKLRVYRWLKKLQYGKESKY